MARAWAANNGFGPVAFLPLAMFALVAVAHAAGEPDVSPVLVAFGKPKPTDWVAVDRVPAAKADLVLGDGYKLEIHGGKVTKTISGPLIHVTDQWLVLREASTANITEGPSRLINIPLIGKLLCRSTKTRVEADMWIPRSAATVAAHLKVAPPAAEMPQVPDAPPLKKVCGVFAAAGDKAETFSGVLTAVDANDVNMIAQSDDGNHDLKIARRNLLALVILETGPLSPGETNLFSE